MMSGKVTYYMSKGDWNGVGHFSEWWANEGSLHLSHATTLHGLADAPQPVPPRAKASPVLGGAKSSALKVRCIVD